MQKVPSYPTIALTLYLAACTTVKGVGQDIEKTGEKIENAAEKK